MTEVLHEFTRGPYDLLNYTVKAEDGEVIIEVNEGDLGRITIEDMEAVDELREALFKAEEYFEELERRKEEL